MSKGKHTADAVTIKKLKEELKQKEKDLFNLQMNFADTLLEIRNLNESNNYSDDSLKTRKISELCTDLRYELLVRKKESTASDNELESS